MIAKHTPGPWAAFYKHKYDEWQVSVPERGSSMKRALFQQGVLTEHPEADARLIAAAPELLAALIDLVELADAAMQQANSDGAEYQRNDELHDARAAIAKATARQA